MTTGEIRVLVVDDDFRVSAIHATVVDRVRGFRVVGQAHTAAQALALAEEHRPDLVLLDIYLPDQDGLETARVLVSGPHPPAVIIVTAARELESVRTALRLGVVHYLVKPFALDALTERLLSFQQMHDRELRLSEQPTQPEVDHLFGLLRGASATGQLSRRTNGMTLQLVRDAVSTAPETVSASDVAEALGLSRATAHRYLTHLVENGELRRELRYGSGRPEHRYRR